MLRNYNITLEILSPVFIGSGEEISKKDCLYLSNERKVYILDNIKLFNGLKKAGMLKKYEDFLMDYRQKNFSMFTRENGIPLNYVKSWAAYELPLNDICVDASRKNGGGSDNILAFMKDKYGCPFIPGSSLKGALRTVIQNALCDTIKSDTSEMLRKQIETEQFEKRTKYLSSLEKKLSSQLFNTLNRNEKKPNDAVNDSFAGIRISDSIPLDVSSLILCQKTDLKPDGSFASLPIKRECLKPGTKIRFSMEIDTDMMNISADDICRYAKKVFNNYKVNFLDKFKSDNIYEINCTTPIVMGGGSGYASKTSVYSLYDNSQNAVKAVQKIMVDTTSTRKQRDPHKHLEDEKKHKVSPHIRKCTQYNGKLYDMGICDMQINEI